jgi:hypothetical protein
LQYSLDSDVKDFYNKRIAPVENSLPSYDEALERICTVPRYAVAFTTNFIQSLQATKRLNCNVIGVPQASFREHHGMPIAKGCPYIRILNHKYVTSFRFTCNLYIFLLLCKGQAVFVGCLTDEVVTDGVSRKLCKKLLFKAALNLKMAQVSFTPWRKHEFADIFFSQHNLIVIILLFCTVINKCSIILHIITLLHIWYYRVILRKLIINNMPNYTSISNAAIVNTI